MLKRKDSKMKENARILVVDDEPMVCISLANWLREENYFVKTVNDGPSAIESLKQEAWDIVLLDYKMPGMDGIEVLHQIKEIAPGTLVLMMTAYASVSNSVQAMKEGAYDYIIKPLDVEELSMNLRKIIERRQLITENLLLRKQLTERHKYENIIFRADPDGCRHERNRSDHRGNRHRKGIGRARHTRHQFAALRSVHLCKLQRFTRKLARKRALRVRERRLHGGGPL
jgi:DNA-binding response OmpR family regulator